MASRHRVARLGALVAVVLAALLGSALPAAAEVTGKFVGTVEGGSGHGFDMEFKNGEVKEVTANLLGVELDTGDGKTVLSTYCIEIDVNARPEASMVEKSWDAFPGDHAAESDKILWILHHSYPNVGLDELAETLDVASLDKKDAISGTQAAIWHFANGAELVDRDDYPNMTKLYDYLVGDENTGMEEQPPASLSIDPESAEAEAGSNAGPFTIKTNAAAVEVVLADGAPEGVMIVDAEGDEITEFTADTQFWLSAPAGDELGAATVQAEAEARVEKGRLFVGGPGQDRTQTLIVASSEEGKAKAEASAEWIERTPPPTSSSEVPPSSTSAQVPPTSTGAAPTTTTVAPPPQGGSLPNTGSTILPVLGIGLLLLGAGVGLVLLQRRRRPTS